MFDIQSIIKRKRSLLLIHSYIYYVLNDNVISDDEWQRIAEELKELQKENGYKWGFYDEVFKDWDGTTGMHLPINDWIREKAHRIIWLHNKNE